MACNDPQHIKKKIIRCALPEVIFDGWNLRLIDKCARECGFDPDVVGALFPSGISDVLLYYSNYCDDIMLDEMSNIDQKNMRIRDQVSLAVKTRFEILNQHREASKLAASYWSVPTRAGQAGKLVWQSADKIWLWAGDTATDYNRYTKRALLSGILSSSALVWMSDEATGLDKTKAFIDRRIEDVMKLNKLLFKFKKRENA